MFFPAEIWIAQCSLLVNTNQLDFLLKNSKTYLKSYEFLKFLFESEYRMSLELGLGKGYI